MEALWAPEGRLRHPLIDREIDGSLVPINNDRTKALVPDLEWQLRTWAWRDDVVFLHFRWNGTVNGLRVAFDGVDRMRVRNDRIVEEVTCIDTYPLRRAADPTLPDAPVVSADDLPLGELAAGPGSDADLVDDSDVERWIARYTESWSSRAPRVKAALWHAGGVLHHPALDRPIDGTTLPVFDDETKAQIPDLEWAPQNWARWNDVLFLEFSWAGTVNGVRVELAGVDRMVLRGDRIAEEIVFFDTYPLRRAIDPSLPAASPIAADDLIRERDRSGPP